MPGAARCISAALLTLLVACSPPRSAENMQPPAGSPEGIRLSLAEGVAPQGVLDLQALILTGRAGQAGSWTLLLSAPGSSAYSVSAPSWLTITPASGPLKSGLALLKAVFVCPARPQNFLGTVGVTTTDAPQSAAVPVVLVCAARSPSLLLFTPVTGAVPGSSVTSNSLKLGGLAGAVPVSTQGGTALLNGVALPASGGTARNGDRLALRVQASASGSTTVAAVTQVGPLTGIFLVATRVDNTPQTLSVSPDHLDFTSSLASSAALLTVTRSPNLAAPSLSGTCAGIASVTPGSSSGTSSSYTVTPVAAGSCSLTFTSGNRSASVPVTVTTSSVVVN